MFKLEKKFFCVPLFHLHVASMSRARKRLNISSLGTFHNFKSNEKKNKTKLVPLHKSAAVKLEGVW